MAAIIEVPWNQVRPMPGQPRTYFSKISLDELATSIKALGQIIPVIVARVGGKPPYELIDGERRWRAVQLAGLPTLRVEVVDEPDPEKRFAMSVVANMGREENGPIERMAAYQRMRRTMGVEEIAVTVGKKANHVRQYLALVDLHPDLADAMHPSTPKAHRLPLTVALQLVSLTRDKQVDAFREIMASPASPTAAAALVLKPSQIKSRDGTHRRLDHWEAWTELKRALNQAANRLGSFHPETAAKVLATRKPEERAKLRELARELADRCEDLVRTMDRRGD